VRNQASSTPLEAVLQKPHPQEKMPGTKMILSVKNEKEVADLWAYLKQFGATARRKISDYVGEPMHGYAGRRCQN